MTHFTPLDFIVKIDISNCH